MGLRTWVWPSCEGLHMGTKTSAGPSVARLGLNKSLLITGRPQPDPQPEEEQSTGAVPVSLGSAGVSCLSLPRRPRACRPWCLFTCSAASDMVLSSPSPHLSSSVKWDPSLSRPMERIVSEQIRANFRICHSCLESWLGQVPVLWPAQIVLPL